MRIYLTRIGLCLAYWVCSAVFVQATETRRYFKDYIATCRDDGFCSAVVYDNPNSAAGVADNWVRIGRAGSENAQWEISFVAIKENVDVSHPVVIIVDDTARFTLRPPNALRTVTSVNEFFLTDAKMATFLLDEMLKGREARIHFTGENGGGQTARISLSGISAALLWIDEQQNRVGSLRQAGDWPGRAAAPPTAPMTYHQAFNSGQVPGRIAAYHKQQQCEDINGGIGEMEIIRAELDGNTNLIGLPCWSGAYNAGFNFYVWYRDTPDNFQRLVFPRYSPDRGWTATDSLINPSFDQEQNVLIDRYKGRGIGDCGTSGSYLWFNNPSAGAQFRLLRMRAKDTCDGQQGNWPIVFEDSAIVQ